MSSAHKRILHLLKKIEQSLGKFEIKQEVKVENNVNGLDQDLTELKFKIGEITGLLMDISTRLKQIERELLLIQDKHVATRTDNPHSFKT